MTDILECNFMFSMQPMEIFKNRFDMIMPGVLVIAQTVQFWILNNFKVFFTLDLALSL